MDSSRLIACYEQLSQLTVQMRAAAEQGQWDQLIGFESQRNNLLAGVKTMDASTTLDESARRRKHELVAGILAHDATIRSLVQAQMGQIQLNIESDQNKLRLRRAYGA